MKPDMLFVEKVSQDRVFLIADNIRGEIDVSLFKNMLYDLIKYYGTIILSWHMTLPAFELCKYPKRDNSENGYTLWGKDCRD